ncbi:hypothetical protein IID20_03910 [Patescibacteria group bacterium]|nr:hypothetical protein [Patescibacteria group bacterium]
MTIANVFSGLGGLFGFGRKAKEPRPPQKIINRSVRVGDPVSFLSRKYGQRMATILGFAPNGRARLRIKSNGAIVRRKTDRLTLVAQTI